MAKKLGLICGFVGLVLASPALSETIHNDTILALVGAGLGDEAIIAKINASDTAFDLTTDDIINLKAKGVSSKVIAAMLSAGTGHASKPAAMSMDSADPGIPHPAGVYILEDWVPNPRMLRMDATISNQAKTGGIFGYALTGGIASISIKASIQNETARVAAQSHTPTFYFFFDQANSADGQVAGAWLSGTAATVASPSEFTLIQLTQKKGRREARVGSMNIGGAKTGVMDKDRLNFTYDMVRPGVYKVSPSEALKPGEYGFIYAVSGNGMGGAATARIFDFSVK
ncbi:MAG: hypothetical protein WC804_18965 [Sphingomonas sp.]|jgi:hypothetical protein|uniref:hypothetical protein n=1 Tax=Sphingomonas sp. TaxID=28214 RepID=UPI0035640B64